MTDDPFAHTRRSALIAALGVAATGASEAQAAPGQGPAPMRHEHDWDWLVGRWRVRHRQLKGRLVGAAEWIEFPGTSTLWLALGGLATLDDNVLEKPGGTYRAITVRAFDPKAGHWLIWWLDGRNPTTLDPPVAGNFKGGVGTFVGDDTLEGRPITVRFIWSRITPASAQWEQAFSADGGATWETNWIMEFTRA